MKSIDFVSKTVSILVAIIILSTTTIVPTVSAASGLNSPPIAYDQTVSINENTQVNINLTASDPERDSLTFSILTPPVNGTLSGRLPYLIYTPNVNYNGFDSFTFKANDGGLDSNIATVSITINHVNSLSEVKSSMTGGGSVFNTTITHSFELGW